MATAAGIFDFPDESDRLLAIQSIAEVALRTSETALRNVNVSKKLALFSGTPVQTLEARGGPGDKANCK